MTKTKDMKFAIRADTLSKRKGIYTARRSFFYRHGGTSEKFAEEIEKELDAKILDHGEQWTSFRGGASVANSTHWWVKFEIEEKEFDIGTRVKLRKDVSQRHSSTVPAHAGYTPEQFSWRDTLNSLQGKTGTITRTFPNSKEVNVKFGKTLIGINTTELVAV